MSNKQPHRKDTDTTAERQKVIKDELSLQFLLKEYERLVEFQKLSIEGYRRMFNIYLLVGSAAVALLLPLADYFPQDKLTIVNVILLGLLFLGVIIFIGLSLDNAYIIQYERAMRLIQDCFTTREPNTRDYLHFRVNQIGLGGNRFQALVIRGLSSGSPKSLLVFANSIVASVFTLKVGVELGLLPVGILPLASTGVRIFAFVAVLHVLGGQLIYKVHGVSETPAQKIRKRNVKA